MTPNLNSIENLWRKLKIRVNLKRPLDVEDLEWFAFEEWNNMSKTFSRRLVTNYRKYLLSDQEVHAFNC